MSDQALFKQNYAPKDLIPKITGRARYSEDFRAEGMLFAKLLLSPMPHARVRRIDTRAALNVEGVVAVATAEDAPEVAPPVEPALTNNPLYQGQPIAAVAAVDEWAAARGVEALRAELTPLAFVLDPLEGLRPGSPNARSEGNVLRGQEHETLKWSGSVFRRAERGEFPQDAEVTDDWSFGDVEDAFARADLVLEEPILHQSQTHHPLEPRSAMAYWRNGKVYLHCSTQSVSQTKRAMATALQMEEEDVVIIGEYCGGGFGSKIRGTVTDLIPAILSRKAQRPVMMRVTRDEETYFGRARPGLQGWTRIGFRADGRVLAIDSLLLQENGPFNRQGDINMWANVVSLTYQPEAMRHRGVAVVTNTPPKSAQRAPGGVQATAMMQPIMDRAARQLGIDPLAMLRINAPSGRALVGPNRAEVTSAFVREALDLGANLFGYEEKKHLSGRVEGSRVTGVGVAWAPFVAGSSGWDGLMVIRPDGKLYVHQGIGNLGSHSVLDTARVAAGALGLEWDQVEVVFGDTSRGLPWSSTQSGSQTTFAHTRSNHAAAQDALAKLREIAAQDLGGSPEQYEVGGGRVFRRGNPSNGMGLGQAAERAIALGGKYAGYEPAEDLNDMTVHAVAMVAGQGLVAAARDNYPHDGGVWSHVACFCVVEVDRETGMVVVKELMGTTDCGTVMHPRNLQAQVHGGIVQGASIARFERWVFDARWGVNANKRFYTAKPASILDFPLETAFAAVDLPDPQSPVGAKGIGEPPICAGAGAMACAIADALGGHDFMRTPLGPDRIVMALEGRAPAYGPLQNHV
jgi:CO/xanthine dehydrogenase Mo-binding subunit